MADFIPVLSNEVEFPFGEHPRIEEGEIPLMWLVTFIKPDIAVTAESIGLYLKRIDGDISGLDIHANIVVYEQTEWTVEPETPAPFWNPVTIASNIDLKSILTPPVGWKAIPVNPFTFEDNHTYTIMFEIISKPYNIDGQIDGIIVSGAQQFDIPVLPPDYPGTIRQAKNVFGVDRMETGFVYTFPVAVSLHGEIVGQPELNVNNVNVI